MGVVFRGRDPTLRRDVAIKMLLDAGERQVERFAREARAAARLRHPGIVAVHEVGSEQGRPYLVMDFVEGETLAALIEREGMLAPRRAAEIVAAVAVALEHAHGLGIVHRDVKPGNVLIDRAGRPLLADFGLAREIESEDRSLTMTGQLLGTPHYCPPEQVRGDTEAIGPRSDVFALGAVLYDAVTGAPPFPGESVLEVMGKTLAAEPEPPRRRNPQVHRDVETIILTCLEKDPGKRYPSAAELAADLRRYLAGEPIHARPVGRRERLVRWSRRNPAFAATVAVAGVVILGMAIAGVALAVYSYREIGDALERTEDALAEAESRRGEAVAARAAAEAEGARAREAEERAIFQASASARSLSRSLFERGIRFNGEGRSQEAWVTLARALALTDDPEIRWSVGDARAQAPRLLYETPRSLGAAGMLLAIDPGAGHLIAVDERGMLESFDLDTGERRRLGFSLSLLRGVAAVAAASPSLRTLAFGHRRRSPSASRPRSERDDAITVVGTELGEKRRELIGHGAPATGLAFVSGDDRLASVSGDGTARLWDLRLELEVARVDLGVELTSLAASSDGGVLAAGSAGGVVHVLTSQELAAGEDAAGRRLASFDGRVDAIAVSPDGRVVAASSGRTLRVWSVGTGATILEEDAGEPIEGLAVVAPRDGARAVVMIARSGGVVIRDLEGSSPALVIREDGPVGAFAVDPAGTVVALADRDGGVRLLDGRSGEERARLSGPRSRLGRTNVAVSPDETMFAISVRDSSKAHLHRLVDGRPDGELRGERGAFDHIRWVERGTLVSAGRPDEGLTLWDVSSRQVAARVAIEGSVKGMVTSDDGRRLAVAVSRGKESPRIEIRKLPRGELERELALEGRHGSGDVTMEFDGFGEHLACQTSRTISLWEVGTGRRLARSTVSHRDQYVKAGPAWLDPRARQVLYVDARGSLRVIDATGRDRPTDSFGGPGAASVLQSIACRGPRIIFGSDFGVVEVWARQGREDSIQGHPGPVSSVALVGDRILAGGLGSARLWERPPSRVRGLIADDTGWSRRLSWLDHDHLLATRSEGVVALSVKGDLESEMLIEHPIGRILELDRDRAGDTIVVVEHGKVLIFDRSERRLRRTLTVEGALGAAVSPDGKRVAVRRNGNRVDVFRSDGTPLWASSFGDPRDGVLTKLEWSPDGSMLAVNPGKGFALLDAETAEVRAVFGDDRVGRLVWSRDGSRLAAADSEGIVVYDAADPSVAVRLEWRWQGFIGRPDFSPDGELVAASVGVQVGVWEVRDGRVVLLRHVRAASGGSGLGAVAFSPDGHELGVVALGRGVDVHPLDVLGVPVRELLAESIAATRLELELESFLLKRVGLGGFVPVAPR